MACETSQRLSFRVYDGHAPDELPLVNILMATRATKLAEVIESKL